MITNIRIANDNREIARRHDEHNIRTILLDDLQKESTEAMARLETITKLWSTLETYRDPMALHEGLQMQQARIAALMRQKDELVAELKEAIGRSDQRYAADQMKHSDDTATLVQRIDIQVEVMKGAYRQHLEMLQTTIDAERLLFRTAKAEKWQRLYEDREQTEQRTMQETKELREEHERQFSRLTLEHEELNRRTKISLERDNAALQVELQTVKAEIMLNSEKLAYNYRVLQKRAEENLIVKAQQKRRLTKLNEIVGEIRTKERLVRHNGDEEVTKLTKEVMKLHTNIMDTGNKATAFATINDEKYHNVWMVNEKEARRLMRQIVQMDQCIYEQHLGASSAADPLDTNNLPAKEELPSFIAATKILCSNGSTVKLETSSMPAPITHHHHHSTIKAIFEKISSQTQWLQDKDLLSSDILDSRSASERTLVKISHVFAALGVRNMNDVAQLRGFFMPFIFCPNCNNGSSDEESITDGSNVSCENHQFVMESAMVVPALRKYIEALHTQMVSSRGHLNGIDSSADGLPSAVAVVAGKETVSRCMSKNDVNTFWEHIRTFVPDRRVRVWNALEIGLTRFLSVIKKKYSLIY